MFDSLQAVLLLVTAVSSEERIHDMFYDSASSFKAWEGLITQCQVSRLDAYQNHPLVFFTKLQKASQKKYWDLKLWTKQYCDFILSKFCNKCNYFWGAGGSRRNILIWIRNCLMVPSCLHPTGNKWLAHDPYPNSENEGNMGDGLEVHSSLPPGSKSWSDGRRKSFIGWKDLNSKQVKIWNSIALGVVWHGSVGSLEFVEHTSWPKQWKRREDGGYLEYLEK